jgi:hypothetical protein
MRTSRPMLTHTQAMAIEEGRAITVHNWTGNGEVLKIRSLKEKNRTAYDAHLCEVDIGGRRVVVNVEDLTRSLRYV